MDVKKELIKVAEELTKEDVAKVRQLCEKSIQWLNNEYAEFINGKLVTDVYVMGKITGYVKLKNKTLFSLNKYENGEFKLIFGEVGYGIKNKTIKYKSIPTLSRIVKYFDKKTVEDKFGFKALDKKELIEEIVKDFKTFIPAEYHSQMSDKGRIEVNGDEITYDFRYIGKWHVPDDVDDDEAEDYDWEVLDDKSYKHINDEFEAWVKNHYWSKYVKSYSFEDTGEKNWVEFRINV